MIAASPIIERYRPRGGAKRLMECRDRRILMDGPAGTGKTSAILHKLVARAEKYPGYRAWIGRQTRTSMSQSVLVTLENKVLPRGHPALTPVGREYRRSYVFPNGSEIVPAGLDTPSVTFSAEYDDMAVFEAVETTQDGVESLLRALRNGKAGYHQLVCDTNPGPTGHWLNQQANKDWFTRILSRHQDNPLLWDEAKNEWTPFGREYITNLEALTGHRRERMLNGKWVSADGLVYPEFDAAVHIIDHMPDGWEKWPKRRSIDWGMKDPFVCQWWARCDDRWYLYRELYVTGKTADQLGPQVAELSKGETYEETVSDHDPAWRAQFARHGVDTTLADKEVLTGIDEVKTRLRKRADGKPGLYFLRDALVERDQTLSDAKRPASTIEEFDAHIWKRHRDGVEKDEVVDRDNHGMDAMRYHVMGTLDAGVMIGTADQFLVRTDAPDKDPWWVKV